MQSSFHGPATGRCLVNICLIGERVNESMCFRFFYLENRVLASPKACGQIRNRRTCTLGPKAKQVQASVSSFWGVSGIGFDMPLGGRWGKRIPIKCKYMASIPMRCPRCPWEDGQGPQGWEDIMKAICFFPPKIQQRTSLPGAGSGQGQDPFCSALGESPLSLGPRKVIFTTTMGFIHNISELGAP